MGPACGARVAAEDQAERAIEAAPLKHSNLIADARTCGENKATCVNRRATGKRSADQASALAMEASTSFAARSALMSTTFLP